MIIVDTNLASELMRPSPDATVSDWVRTQPGDELSTTAITVAEIRYGIDRLPAGRRKDLLEETADEIFASFADRVLPFDAAAATHYPMILTRRERAGLPINGFDAQIASICRTHGAALATRNGKDFEGTGVDVIDPWRSP